MKHFVVSICLFLLCNLLGNAQGMRSAPTPSQKARLFQRNYPLIEKLVDNSLKLTKHVDPLARSEDFRGTFETLELELRAAIQDGDKSRLSELNRHLRSLLDRGLLPNLGAAREQISENHPNESRLFGVRDMTQRIAEDLDQLLDDSPILQSSEARELRETLQATRFNLQKQMEKQKPE